MININEYHFIVTKASMFRSDLIAKNFTVKAKSVQDAWIIVALLADDDINSSEHIEKIELIEVE